MNGWSAQEYGVSATVAASATDSPVSKEYPITAGGALRQVVKLVCSGVTAGAGITAKLQSAIGSEWVDSKSVSITADGTYYIRLLAEAAADQAYLPLLNRGRVVLTTGAGSAATVDSVQVLQEL